MAAVLEVADVFRRHGEAFRQARAGHLGRGAEQDGIDGGLVLEGDLASRRRQGEDDMEIGHRQQLGLAVGEPLLGSGSLAFWAMPIATD